MLKFLLSTERHELRREYKFRVLNVLLVCLLVLALIIAVSLFAPYTIVRLERNLINSELEVIKNSDVSKRRADFEKDYKHLMIEYRIFSQEFLAPTDFFEVLLKNKTADVQINSYNFSRIEGEKLRIKIDLRGASKTRSALVDYIASLKQEKIFSKVELPITSLTKETDIPFSISIETVDNFKNI